MTLQHLITALAVVALIAACGPQPQGSRAPKAPSGFGVSPEAGTGAGDDSGTGFNGGETATPDNPAGDDTGDDWQSPGEVKPDDEDFVGYDDDPEGPCGYGKIFGVVCSKTEQMYVNGAKVYIDAVDCDGQPVHIETHSDQNGYYTLEHVPNGTHTVYVEKDEFTNQYNVVVLEQQLTDVTAVGHKECFKAISDDCPLGSVTGYVCAPNETTTIGGATVSVDTKDCNGHPVKIGALSDGDGNFLLENVPSGPVVVDIKKGSFETSYNVVVPDGGNIHAPDVVQDACFEESSTKIAVGTGDWDTIQNILDGLGIVYDLFDGMSQNQQTMDLLSDLDKMQEYDIIFFNCGGDHDQTLLSGNMNAMISNLQLYVAAGGSVYASDWAFVYVEWPWPKAIGFTGGDMNTFGPKVGMQGTYTGTVVDPALSATLGKSKVELNYDLGAWVTVADVDAATKVHIVGDVTLVGNGVPLMVSHEQGKGKVLFTTFHNEPQISDDMTNILNFLVFEL